MNLPELQQKLREETIKGVSIQHQFEGILKLYEAAVIMNNYALMEVYRQQAHDLLDVKLDTCNSIGRLAHQMAGHM